MTIRRRRVMSAAVLAPLVAGVLAACGGGEAEPDGEGAAVSDFERYAELTGQEREDTLLADAKEEGGLSVYTSNTNLEESIVPAFEEKYGLEVTVYRATNEAVVQRALQEAETGRPGNDLIEGDSGNMNVLTDAEVITPYQSEIRDGMPEEAQFENWTAARYTTTLPVWNTDLVPDSQLPASFEELADPKWAGQLSLESTDYSWYLTLYKYFTEEQGMSDNEFSEMFQGIAANSQVVNGHPELQSLISAGEIAIGVSAYLHSAFQAQADGAPAAFQPLFAPVVRDPLGLALMANAEHPASALLFVDFYLTDGQAIIADQGRDPANPDAVPGYVPTIPEDVEILEFDHETIESQGREWAEAYNRLLQGGDDVLP